MPLMNRTQALDADQRLIEGIAQHFADLPSIPVGGRVLSPKQMIALLQTRIEATKATHAAEAARAAAVQAERRAKADTEKVVSAIRRIVSGMFADAPEELAAFGMKVRKTPAMDVDAKRAAVAKAKATREARHTLGPKQRLRIHGVVPPVPTAIAGH